MAKEKFYTLDAILEYNAHYNVIYGERSNGKTTSVLAHGLKKHIESGYQEQLAIVRRWDTDFKGKNGQQMFEGIVALGWVREWTKGEYNAIYYFSQRWYLCYYNSDGEKEKQAAEPFALGFAINMEEHYKSTSYPNITVVLFDEFITRSMYIPEEFIRFQNLLSTIIRLRTNVRIFMCGNTINRFCPYFNEMGLSNVKRQKKGTIDLYTYGESELRVAVEYSDFPAKRKDSNLYFAFNNPKLEMITHGGWEIDVYPHLPVKYVPSDVLYKFYVLFDEELLQGNIISVDDVTFLYFHNKTTPIQDDNKQLVYQQAVDYRRNYRTSFAQCLNKVDKFIYSLIINKKVFYQSNEIGEIINNYLMWSGLK